VPRATRPEWNEVIVLRAECPKYAAGDNMPANLIAVRPGCYGQYKNEAFTHLPTIGIRYLEIGVPPEAEWPALKAQIVSNGLKVSSVAGGADFSKPDHLNQVTHLCKGAKEFGAKIIFLSVKSGGVPLPECYAGLRKMGDIAAGYGCTLVLETHPDLVTNGDVAAQTMQNTNHPNVRLNYDSANLYYYNEGVDGIAELKKFLPWLGAVHLKETNGGFKTWYFPGLHEGEGIVNFPEIFRICNAHGFYGPFTMEIEGIKDEKLTREQALARMANSSKYLQSIGVM
jgi:L-ribulose-5-phosphate 3-epimerase